MQQHENELQNAPETALPQVDASPPKFENIRYDWKKLRREGAELAKQEGVVTVETLMTRFSFSQPTAYKLIRLLKKSRVLKKTQTAGKYGYVEPSPRKALSTPRRPWKSHLPQARELAKERGPLTHKIVRTELGIGASTSAKILKQLDKEARKSANGSLNGAAAPASEPVAASDSAREKILKTMRVIFGDTDANAVDSLEADVRLGEGVRGLINKAR